MLCLSASPPKFQVGRWCFPPSAHHCIRTHMYVALLSKVEASDERSACQELFPRFLVAAHACMVVGVIVKTAVILIHGMKRATRPPRCSPASGPLHAAVSSAQTPRPVVAPFSMKIMLYKVHRRVSSHKTTAKVVRPRPYPPTISS